MRRTAGALGVVMAGLVAGGCSTVAGRFPVITTKNVELSRVDLKAVGLQRNNEGSDGRLWFLFIPFGYAPTVELAVDRALERGRGDFMVSARVESFFWTFFLFSYESYRAYGDVGDSLGLGSRDMQNAPSRYGNGNYGGGGSNNYGGSGNYGGNGYQGR